ncbi:hypothetical protein [Halobacteriovorax sp. RT-2-6]|uniref:hypothetical protein n=1 Tax=unclassified Halobacteriovorax TaxID=2639665 RepID=UPI00399967DD
MKITLVTLLALVSLNSFAAKLEGNYESSSGCAVSIECEDGYCRATVEKGDKSLVLEGELETDKSDEFRLYRQYTGIETRWFHDDEFTGFNDLVLEKQKNGKFMVDSLDSKYNLFPHFPKKERNIIVCKNLVRVQ